MQGLRRWLPFALALLLLGLVAFGVWKALAGRSGTPPKVPKISLIPATPPPPPPPKEERRPEPPKEQKEVRTEQPAPPKEAPPAPASADLKMEGAAGDGPGAFSSGRITSEDIAGAMRGGTGGRGLFNPFSNYAQLLKGELQRHLARDRALRQRAYRIDLQVWVATDGTVARNELLGSTGDAEADEQIRNAVAALRFTQAPPEHMPQPIRLRITTGRG